MKLPRNISGIELAKHLKILEYKISHRTGGHIRLTTNKNGTHHITIPAHDSLRIGTLNSILRDIAEHHKMTRTELMTLLFHK